MEHTGYGTKIHFWGKRALFTRPEFKAERFSYEVMTPSAAIGMLEAIYWHPGMEYVIDKIYVLKTIQFESIKKNEVKSKGSISEFRKMMEGGKVPQYITKKNIDQRSSTLLKDVDYIVDCHFEVNDKAAPGDNPGKFAEILRRRAEKGQCFSQPYFGTRDYSANFELWNDAWDIHAIAESRDFGVMLHSLDYTDPENIHPRFFMAEMVNGVIQVSGRKLYE